MSSHTLNLADGTNFNLGVIRNNALEEAPQKSSGNSDQKPPAQPKPKTNIRTAKHLLETPAVKLFTLWGEVLPKVGVAALAGASDTGKSAMLRELAACVAAGRPYLGWPTYGERKAVLYFASEDGEEGTKYVFQKQNRTHGFQSDDLPGLRFMFNYKENLLNEITVAIKYKPVDLIVIDAFSDVFTGFNMNDATQVRKFLQPYSNLAEECRTCILFLHHSGKRTEQGQPSKHNLLGSQGFEAKMRLVMELREDYRHPELRHLCVVKGNYLPREFKRESYELRFTENMTFEPTGNRVPFAQLVKPDEEEEKREQRNAELIALHGDGYSYRDLSARFGISKSQVERIIKAT